MYHDISMAGSVITFTGNSGLKVSQINEFSSNEDPIQVSDLEVAAGEMNINGEIVTWAKPNPVQVSFSLIPFSASQIKLDTFLAAMHIGGANYKAPKAKIDAMTISVPAEGGEGNKGLEWTFKNGRLLSGPPAVGSSTEGRGNSCTYVFIFESVNK